MGIKNLCWQTDILTGSVLLCRVSRKILDFTTTNSGTKVNVFWKLCTLCCTGWVSVLKGEFYSKNLTSYFFYTFVIAWAAMGIVPIICWKQVDQFNLRPNTETFSLSYGQVFTSHTYNLASSKLKKKKTSYMWHQNLILQGCSPAKYLICLCSDSILLCTQFPAGQDVHQNTSELTYNFIKVERWSKGGS